jgi:hypothetical protein
MEAKLHVALYFQKFENHIFKFQKVLNFFVDVANNGKYKHAKSQCEILSNLGYTKMKNAWI